MSDIKLFKISTSSVNELPSSSIALEKSLQSLIENNLEIFLGVRFLASEFSTGKQHGGRMDTLGIDENGCPVIIEYKRAANENVITQGLFYLDWLMDHKKDFEWLVMDRFGGDAAKTVEWSAPRLLCIAGDFNKYDEHAIKQMNRNIELIRYRKYGDELLLLDLVNSVSSPAQTTASHGSTGINKDRETASANLTNADQQLTDLFEALRAFLMALGDDVQEKTLKHYFAFRRIKNFACAVPYKSNGSISIFLKIDPSTVTPEEGYLRNMTGIGHYGTGDIEVTIRNPEDLERAKSLMIKSYESS